MNAKFPKMNIDDAIAECMTNISNILDSLLSLKQGKGGEKDGKNPNEEKMEFLRKALRDAISKLAAMQVAKVLSILSALLQDKQKDDKTHEAQPMPQPHTVKFSSHGKMTVPLINSLNSRTTVIIGV